MILTVCVMLAIVSKDLFKFFFEAEFEAMCVDVNIVIII